MTVFFKYLPLEEVLSLELERVSTVSSSQQVFSSNTEIVTCVGRGHAGSNFGILSRKSSYSGTIGAKTFLRDPSATQVRNPGLSRRFRDSWQLLSQDSSYHQKMTLSVRVVHEIPPTPFVHDRHTHRPTDKYNYY